MKIKNLPAALAAMAMTLAGCTQDELKNNPLADGPVAMTFTAGIATTTKAAGSTFEGPDEIGIYPIKDASLETAQSNRRYTYSNGNFMGTPTPYYFQDRKSVTFHAYYPYESSLDGTTTTIDIDTRTANQVSYVPFTDSSNWRKNDYLFASASTDITSPYVFYTDKSTSEGEDESFHHVMSKVKFCFQAGTTAGVPNLSKLTAYKIATPLIMDGSFSPVTGSATTDNGATAESIEMQVPIEENSTATTFDCDPLILLPQAVTDGKLSLEVTYNQETYKAELSLPQSATELKAGYSYVFTVTINNTALVVSDAEIADWIDGGNSTGNATMD